MFPAYAIQDGVLLRRMPVTNPLTSDPWRVVLPVEKVPLAIWEVHNSFPSIHPGVTKSYLKLKETFYWPNMFRDVAETLRQCEVCKAYKIANTQPRGQMCHPKDVSMPLQSISIDLIGPLPVAYYGYKYILSMVDVFSKYVWLIPLKKVNASSIIKALESEIFFNFGVPRSILCDNATVFRSNQFLNFLRSFHIESPTYTPYYTPQANTVERYNQSVVTCLGILVGENQRNWSRMLHKVKLYLNSCINLATGFSPNFLMFGREVLMVPTRTNSQTQGVNLAESRAQYASNLSCLSEVYAKVADNLSMAFLRNSRAYNTHRSAITLNVGDTVWRKNFSRSSGDDYFSGKLAPRFIKCRVTRVISRTTYELHDFDSSHSGRYHIKDILK